jgi:hypothetical protein
MVRNIAPLAVLMLTATQTAISAQTTNVQSLMGDGYTVAGVVQSLAGGGGRFPAERQCACLLLCHREAWFGSPRYAILQTGEIVER